MFAEVVVSSRGRSVPLRPLGIGGGTGIPPLDSGMGGATGIVADEDVVLSGADKGARGIGGGTGIRESLREEDRDCMGA